MAQSVRSLVKSGSIMSALTLLSRVLGLLREMTKAALLGTSPLSDAFSVAFMIPNLFRRLFAEGSISAAFVPTLKEYMVAEEVESGKREALSTYLSSFFTFLTFFVSLFTALGVIAAPLIVRVFSLAEFDETVLLTRVMFPFLAFISAAALFQGVLNSVHSFVPSGLAPILLNLLTIGCAWGLSPFMKNPARAMAVGIVAGGFLEAAIQAPFVWRRGFRPAFVNLKNACANPGVKKTLRLILPTIAGMAAYQLNDLVSTALASGAGEGVVSSLQYSLRLQELMLGVFAVSVGTVLLPDLAESAKTGAWERFYTRLSGASRVIALITVPVTFFAFAEGETMIRLLFQTRRFDERSVALTLAAFRPHIAGLYFIALNRVLAPAFYAQSDSRSPTIAGIASFAFNMLLAALLVTRFKGAGLALALSLAGLLNTALLLVFLAKKSVGSGQKRNAAETSGVYLNNSQSFLKKPHFPFPIFNFPFLNLLPHLLFLLKITVFSAIALVPMYAAGRPVTALCAGLPRLAALALPLSAKALVFGGTGLLLLAVSRGKRGS